MKRFDSYLLLAYYCIFSKLQQELFGTRITESDSGLGVLTRSLNLDNGAYPEALVLYLTALVQVTGSRV